LFGVGDVERANPELVVMAGGKVVEPGGVRRVAATRSPRSSSCSVRVRPKPLEVPVMNQVFVMTATLGSSYQSHQRGFRGFPMLNAHGRVGGVNGAPGRWPI